MVVVAPENHAADRHPSPAPGAPYCPVNLSAQDCPSSLGGVDGALSGPDSVKSESSEDGDDESAIRESDLSVRSDGSSDTSLSSYTSRTSSGSLLKPALKRSSSEERSSLRVSWAPDVYDPIPSSASHTKNKPKLYKPAASAQYHSRRYKGKHGGHSKSGKKPAKGDSKESSNTKAHGQTPKPVPTSADSLGEPMVSDLKVTAETSDLEKDENSTDVPPLVDAELEESAGEFSQVMEGDCLESPEMPAGAGAACGQPVIAPLELSQAMSLADANPGSRSPGSPTGSAGSQQSKSSKKRTKKSSSKRKGSSPSEKEEPSRTAVPEELLDVTNKRLCGATALAAGDVDAARELVLGALVGSRMLKSEAEQARCLRLLADTESGSRREKTLVLAVRSFEATNLAFEHAEALLCLAQHLVQQLLGVTGAARSGRSSCFSSQGMNQVNPRSTAVLMSAKGHLKEAAGLLLSCPALGPALVRKGVESPTGRRRKMRSSQSQAAELSAATGVMGSICELWGRVCLNLEEFEEASMHLAAAASNGIWRCECPEDAAHVDELLESINRGLYHAKELPRICTVF